MSDRHPGARLGFGTAALTSLGDRAAAVRLLDAAFDAGITHFDTARLYGFGHAEGIVGEFLRRRRDAVTIATKFGLEPPSGVANNATLVGLAKKTLRRVPFIADRLRRRAHGLVRTGTFTPEAAARSLERSLAELRTDRVDLLLLHECTMVDARREDLLAFLEAQIARGTVGAVGIATDARQLGGDVSTLPALHRVIQLEDSVLAPWLSTLHGIAEREVITHSALKPVPLLVAAARRDPVRAATWSDRLGDDVTDSTVVARLLLAHALTRTARGRVLFSTTKPERIAANVRDLASVRGVDQVELFVHAMLPDARAPHDAG